MKFRNSRSDALIQPYHFHKDTMTQKQFGFDTDINNIVRGMTQPLPVRQALSDTVDEVRVFSPDMYERALYVKAEAENAFNALPSNVREYFNNSPKAMLEFLGNPENDEKAIELGLKYVDSNKQYQSDLLNAVKSSQTAEKAVTLDEESKGA